MQISERIARVRQRIEDAAKRAGRRAEDVALMAVTKTQQEEAIREAYGAGLRLFGENRVQEFENKFESICDLVGVEWHLIGHLQTNKAARAAGMFFPGGVDSVDSLKLAEKLNEATAKLERKLPVLIEINVGGEEAKSGVAPVSRDFEEILRAAPRLEWLEFRGLMTVPPFLQEPEQVRPYFRTLRGIRDEVARRKLPGVSMEELSMGMSHDFEIAIEEGSTCVRVGTAIFGARPTSGETAH
jgi:pyridoxal phosphate enzyme (YggS family)